jgi:hypothetical protein
MATTVEALEMAASSGWWKEWRNPAWKQFVLTGDEKHLKKLPKFEDRGWLPAELLSALPAPDQIDESGIRLLRACHAAGHPQAIGAWIQQCTTKAGPDSDQFDKACALVIGFGCSKLQLETQVAKHVRPLRMPDGSPTPAGHFLLSLQDEHAEELFRSIGRDSMRAPEITALFVAHAPQRWKNS